jgi:polar amino acid transport system substrate-binding protein
MSSRPSIRRNVPRWMIALIATLAGAATAWACEPGTYSAKYPALSGKTLRIGTTGDSPPFSYRDPKAMQHVIGVNADYMRAVGECLGTPVEIIVSNYAGLVPGVGAGQIDAGISTIFYTPDRAKQVDFIVYLKGATGVIVRKDFQKPISSLGDLCGMNATAVVGALQVADLEAASADCVKNGKKPISITMTQGGDAGPLLLQSGRVDFYFGPALPQSVDETKFKIVFSYTSDLRIGVIVKKASPLGPAIAETMTRLQADGTEAKIYAKYDLSPSFSTPIELRTR